MVNIVNVNASARVRPSDVRAARKFDNVAFDFFHGHIKRIGQFREIDNALDIGRNRNSDIPQINGHIARNTSFGVGGMHRASHFADSVQNSFHVKGRAPEFGFEIGKVSFVEHAGFRLEFVKVVSLCKGINDF